MAHVSPNKGTVKVFPMVLVEVRYDCGRICWHDIRRWLQDSVREDSANTEICQMVSIPNILGHLHQWLRKRALGHCKYLFINSSERYKWNMTMRVLSEEKPNLYGQFVVEFVAIMSSTIRCRLGRVTLIQSSNTWLTTDIRNPATHAKLFLHSECPMEGTGTNKRSDSKQVFDYHHHWPSTWFSLLQVSIQSSQLEINVVSPSFRDHTLIPCALNGRM